MVFLETALESKMNPLVALGRSGSLGLSGFVNKFNADAELLDDLVCAVYMQGYSDIDHDFQNDHWTAKSHKACHSIQSLTMFANPRSSERTQLAYRTVAGIREGNSDPNLAPRR